MTLVMMEYFHKLADVREGSSRRHSGYLYTGQYAYVVSEVSSVLIEATKALCKAL